MEDEALIKRVQSLLALSTSSNEHEAAAAASKAQELIQKYNIDQARLYGVRSESYLVERFLILTEKDNAGVIKWRRELLFAVARNNFCTALAYKGKPNMAVIGVKHNIDTVHWLFTYVADQLEQISRISAKVKKPNGSHGLRWKNSWFLGAVSVVEQRMGVQTNKFSADPNSKALVVSHQSALDEAMGRLFPNLKAKSVRRSRIKDYVAFRAGREDGETVLINRSLTA